MADEKTIELWKSEWKEYKTYAEPAFDRYVTKSNDLVRQLALAGIAMVWVFRETAKDGSIALSTQIRWAAILFVVALAIDLVHYLYGTFSVNTQLDAVKTEEQKAITNGNAWPHNPSGPPPDLSEGGVRLLFCLKTCAAIVGAAVLLHYLAFKV
jgi:hypothetical protein